MHDYTLVFFFASTEQIVNKKSSVFPQKVISVPDPKTFFVTFDIFENWGKCKLLSHSHSSPYSFALYFPEKSLHFTHATCRTHLCKLWYQSGLHGVSCRLQPTPEELASTAPHGASFHLSEAVEAESIHLNACAQKITEPACLPGHCVIVEANCNG